MRDQENKLRKVKQILAKDSSSSSHTPVQSTRSVTTLYQIPFASETKNINSQVLSSQSSKRVCTCSKG